MAVPSEYDKDNKSDLEEAIEFLNENLTDITPSKEFEKDVRAAGISIATFRRAKKELKIRPSRSDGKWYLKPTDAMRKIQIEQGAQTPDSDAQGEKVEHLEHLKQNQHVTEHKNEHLT